jgi:MoaA/NifB/PqqE/SkfB family radical SAM enzyme
MQCCYGCGATRATVRGDSTAVGRTKVSSAQVISFEPFERDASDLTGRGERKVCWRITRRCNLRCLHCLSGFKNDARLNLGSQDNWRVLTNLTDCEVTRITWTGGEPTLSNDLPELIRKCHESAVMSTITTHGLKVPHRLLEATDPALDRYRLSFDGLRSTHNALRGVAGFERTLVTLGFLAAAGYSVEANVTVMEKTVAEVPALIKLLVNAGVSRIVLMTLMNRESAAENKVKSANREALEWLRQQLARVDEVEIILNEYSDIDDRYVVIESDGEVLVCSNEADTSVGFAHLLGGDKILNMALRMQTLAHRQSIIGAV